MLQRLKIKIFLLLIALFSANNLFALSCPVTGGVIDKGDSLEEVIRRCPATYQKKTYIKTIPIAKQWIYYKPHFYDAASSVVTILFRNERVQNINITDNVSPYATTCTTYAVPGYYQPYLATTCTPGVQNLSWSGVCGFAIGAGDTSQAVINACGLPAIEQVLQSVDVEVTELTYPTQPSETLIFENGILIDGIIATGAMVTGGVK